MSIPLLADFHPKGEVAKAYGVFIDERGHNQRALVMIGPDLTVTWSHQAPTPLEIPGANLIFDALEQGLSDLGSLAGPGRRARRPRARGRPAAGRVRRPGVPVLRARRTS